MLVLTHRNPDPDALGSAIGLMHLLRESAGAEGTLALNGDLFRAENREMAERLEIESVPYASIRPADFGASVLVDTQPGFGHTVVPPEIPLLVVTDHHVPPDGERPAVPFFDVCVEYGATATMVYEYLRRLEVPLPPRVATALFCGVRFDTNDLARNVSPNDARAYQELLPESDAEALARIKTPPLPKEYFRDLRRTLGVARSHGGLVLAFLGRVTSPDMVAEMADFLLRYRGTKWALVGGLHESTYYLSLRTDLPEGDAYLMLREVLRGEGTFGGHGRIAGARIPVSDPASRALHVLERRIRERALAVNRESKTPAERLA